MDKVPMTLDGFNRLEEELKRLKTVERPEIIKAIALAREHGDLSENAEYHAAKERQSFNEGRISEIENKIANAEIIDVSKLTGKTIKFGAYVKLIDEETEEESVYQFDVEHYSDIYEGRLSITAPLARALIGKSIGDAAEVSAPKGSRGYEILDVIFK